MAGPSWDYKRIVALRAPRVYVIVWHAGATEEPKARIQAFQAGARMVTHDPEHLAEALGLIAGIRGTGAHECPWCGLAGLSALELWQHQPLYHIYERDKTDVCCPVCSKATSRLTRHINLTHGPEAKVDERTGVFALAIVRRPSDGKFLMVQERYHEGYWVPGGGVDPGESLMEVTGILTIEASHHGAWRRIIFLAEPLPGSEHRCKTLPDVESAGACWVAAAEVAQLPLRCESEPLTWIPHVAGGGPVLPLDPAVVPQLGRVFPDYTL
ncbi:hypothetical protein HYH03_012411 [Edaphochlamys debaryana]|uniref:Di19 zinc-binding domain-containing protein n=1 Tax=Edaphochlamys debaryana TaxID=47281 RepID=A0A835XYF8_9CHLO|nr:hypothetical protein HYH03_012411 [Edaphochlamys debaryana]|eukprot:KAG2489185.1 hypothetical protein HYH03_012411 [Edaphochlamys debaryana]